MYWGSVATFRVVGKNVGLRNAASAEAIRPRIRSQQAANPESFAELVQRACFLCHCPDEPGLIV
jgi:hypothetical protein